MASTSRGRGEPFLRLLPFAVMSVVAALELIEGTGTGYLPLLSLGPAFASLTGGMPRAAAVGALALLMCATLAAHHDIIGTRANNLTLVSITGVTAAGMLASAIRMRNERELADIRTVAEAAQRVLLRPVPRRVGPVHAAVRYISAAARARIGGDLYEVVTTPKGVRVIVGDVQGKGLGAVETAAVVLGAFREAAYDEEDLHGVTARLEKALTRHLTSEQFVTAVLAELGSDDRVQLVNCGHPPPLLIRPDGRIDAAEPPDVAPPLGMTALAGGRPPLYEVPFTAHDQLLLYTDGVIEARNGRGEFYPLAERLDALRATDPERALDDLHADLLRHVGAPITDDAALLLLRRRRH
ncbi:PP2C family protein-serine/threonine phosphatase [Actinomadura vinacea]|uniref:PP2C family protein-serine/threonine phosphatase n=1 Tax=Actinomadura vinacea TaxID=115336 RepID=UPI0031D8890F